MRTCVGAIVAVGFSTGMAVADDVGSAAYLCALVDATGLASAKCETSVWNSAVIATVDMKSGEARDVCGKIAGHMAEKGRTFKREWTLQIRSPYSGENSIAYCNLPRG
jgi:hypothetical protein